MKRPLLWGFVTLSLGIIAAFYKLPVWVIVCFAGILAGLPLIVKNIKVFQIGFALVLFCLGVALGYGSFPETDQLASFYEKAVSVLGVVTDYPRATEDRLTINLNTKEMISTDDENDVLKSTTGLKATIYFQSEVNKKGESGKAPGEERNFINYVPGDILLFKGILSEPAGKRNPGGFDYDLYLKSQSIDGLLTVQPENIKLVGQESSFYYQILGIKKSLENSCDTYFSENVADLLKGVIFGEKDINEDLSQSFQDAGVTHVLSVSGLHVGYVFLALSFLLMAIKIKKGYWMLFLAPVLLFYVALTGFVPPVIRASIMLLCLTLGQGIHRERDSLNQLCLAGIVILCIWPAQLFQAGFQLSMAAVLGIVLFYEPLLYRYEKRRNKKHSHHQKKSGPIVQGLVLTFCATVGTLPILLYHFKSFTTMSFFSNLIVVPLIGVLLLAGMVFLIIASIFPFLGPVIAMPIAFLGESTIVVLDGINDLGKSLNIFWINRGGFSIAEMGLFFLAIFFISGYFYLKLKSVKIATVSLGIGFMLILLVSPLFPKNLVVTILDVGQGDSILIETPGGRNYLVDGGGYLFERSTKISESVLYPALYSKNIRQLDAIFLTHNHVDHSQGVEELIFDGYPVKNLFMSIQSNNEKLLDQQMAPVSLLKKGSVIEGGDGVMIKVYNPEGEISPKEDDEQNNASLVMAISYQNTNLLLCGDIEADVEKQLVEELEFESGQTDFQIIKIPHHGSKTSSTLEFIQAVEPEMAVISVGAHNLFGHPNDEVLKRLDQEKITTLRTDHSGAIEITSNGDFIHYKNYVY
ncbi:MAG: DNA internalization-related competence protein ComEC/Rec2 [Acetobacterium woodii]|nr:DNA internalization-related competence protein ComEC/Rec2 [Acetobacterium woodii]